MSTRPPELFPLFAELETLEGVGPKTAKLFEHLHVLKPRDLVFTLPYTGVDRALRPSVLGLDYPCVATVEIAVIKHHEARARGRPTRVQVEDSGTSFELVFFHARGEYLNKILPEGAKRVVSGKLEMFDGENFDVLLDQFLRRVVGGLVPVPDLDDVRRGLRIGAAARESLRAGRAVSIEGDEA